MLINIIIFISTFIFMEFFTWFFHKYVMHGFMWYFHEDHHDLRLKKGFWEKNDFFFLVFSIPSIVLFYYGNKGNGILDYKTWIGAGILLYGIFYLLVHDIIVHQRFSFLKSTNIKYIKALRKAHKIHHKNIKKEEGKCFGILYVPKKYRENERVLLFYYYYFIIIFSIIF